MLTGEYLIIVGCSRRKVDVNADENIRAIDLYTGGVFPDLKEKFNLTNKFLDHLYILSGNYGLINSKDQIKTYDHQLTYEQASFLAARISREVVEIATRKNVKNICVIAEPNYLLLISGLLKIEVDIKLYWEPQINGLSNWAYQKISQLLKINE